MTTKWIKGVPLNRVCIGSYLDFMDSVEPASLVFLDPPFNTGRQWMDYNDNLPFGEWLDMIKQVTVASRDILTQDGSVWVNVDEHYSHHVRMILDTVYGPDCWISTVVWKNHYRASVCNGIKTMHNPIFVYSRTPKWKRRNGLEPDERQLSKYKNVDNDPRGPWRYRHDGAKAYLSDLLRKGAVPQSWWNYDVAGHTEKAKVESGGFATPKPLDLLRRIIQVGSNPGDHIVDPMAGSGTTAVAAHELGRRFTIIEKSEDTYATYISNRLSKIPHDIDRGVAL